MLIAQGALSHVGQLDRPLGASIHEPVAAEGVELCGCDDFSKLLHVSRLDINNVEALILNIEIPQVDSQVIAADECLAVTVHRDTIDVVGVGICVGATRDGGDNSIVVG